MSSDFLPFEIQRFDKPRTPLHVWAMVACGVACLVIVLLT